MGRVVQNWFQDNPGFVRNVNLEMKSVKSKFRLICYILSTIGHLHYDIILLLRPDSFRVLLSCAN